MEKYKELLFLKSLKGIGKATISKRYIDVLKNANTFNEIIETVKEKESFSSAEIEGAIKRADKIYSAVLEDKDITVITLFDDNYPNKLRIMGHNAPLILYVKGNIEVLLKSGIAVVGTRNPSIWSMQVEERLVKKILEISDKAIISGLAIGCDKIAHETTVSEGKITIAVLPSGVNVITPASHKELAMNITSSGGCLVSEYEPNTTATKTSYVERDAIVAALADIIFVVECEEKSGTMHTVDYAVKYRKKTACYYTDDISKGRYAGNKRMLKEKGALKVSDTDELQKMIGLQNESINEFREESEQMTLKDICSDL